MEKEKRERGMGVVEVGVEVDVDIDIEFDTDPLARVSPEYRMDEDGDELPDVEPEPERRVLMGEKAKRAAREAQIGRAHV